MRVCLCVYAKTEEKNLDKVTNEGKEVYMRDIGVFMLPSGKYRHQLLTSDSDLISK